MPREFKILSGANENREASAKLLSAEETLLHVRNVTASLLNDATNTWADIWSELQDVSDAHKPFTPPCGWPDFLEKVWLLGHYLGYAKKFCEGKE